MAPEEGSMAFKINGFQWKQSYNGPGLTSPDLLAGNQFLSVVYYPASGILLEQQNLEGYIFFPEQKGLHAPLLPASHSKHDSRP